MKACIICKTEEGKYKCPTCLVYYCSVPCCNKHRNTKCTLTKRKEDEIVTDNNKYEFRTRDTIPHKKLKMLEEDKSLKNLLSNPHLRSLLKTVDKSEQPETIMQKAMLEPIFVEFADACLKVVEPEESTDN